MAPISQSSSTLLGSSPTMKTRTLAVATVLVAMLAQAPLSVNAHIEMISPPSLRSKSNTQYSQGSQEMQNLIDYTNTAPLAFDGSNFACKGYAGDVPGKSHAVDTVKAGQDYQVKLDGSATHEGGSCQFSLSYDGGQNFGVIHSVIGGCPLAKQYSFKIPNNVPAGKNVLLSWTWFNKVGNREMYMNCAAINIESSSTSPVTLPAIFRANSFGPSCRTVEQDELVFPNPGSSVVYGGMWTGKKPGKSDLKVEGCSSDQLADKFVTLKSNTAATPGSGSGSGSDGESNPKDQQPVESTEPTSVQPVTTTKATLVVPSVTVPSSSASSAKTVLAPVRGGASTKTNTATSCTKPASSSTKVASSSTKAAPTSQKPVQASSSATSTKLSTSQVDVPTRASSAPVTGETPGVVCTGSGLKCSEDGGSFSMCAGGVWVSMGLVAPGTTCKNGQIGFANDAAAESCSPGSLKCSDDGTSFSVCNNDGESYARMGLVAPGTLCQNGKIIASTRRLVKNDKRNVKRHGAMGPRRLSHNSS
ncbi:lytic polysaccharide monooxygenase [Cystobasidium minutum MCA 4210]|uniref:lytic polysaccharide monooxygenase n=1 Tax=Cystobasidium minutum MCA 4210 TaxID=1397322 RepID=UPI0034CEC9C5|eukprot:jgi/Rhomi1/191074/estExt_fgenesh1_pg.C_70047